MFLYVRSLLIIGCCLAGTVAFAQSPAFNTWFFSNHEQKLSRNWSLLGDFQIRSSSKAKYIKLLLFRPAVQYRFSEKTAVATGYAYLLSYEKEEGQLQSSREHRIWQQLTHELKFAGATMNNRLRTEQRFLQNNSGKYEFAQRLRTYFRIQRPLVRTEEFKRGFYLAAQNELFLNTDNKVVVNDRIFDQNRVYAGSGFRFSEAVELEAGYMFRYQLNQEGRSRDHILQVSVNTVF